ncbi:COP23 domain-containing protein [Scytonema sp. NUACC26]|uniref:COP23 domain-containing protein n=1 Tax=Scytonema sp. NUACC26 TaxID=3140176 RepID=UPI0034DBF58B
MMKLQLSAKKFTAIAVGIASLAAFAMTAIYNQPSQAQSTNFFCQKSQGVPATYARTQSGNIAIIRWISGEFPPPWTPMQRCIEVSRRFQKNYDNGTLKILKLGSFNQQTVLCAATSINDSCTDNTLLFTFKPGSKPKQTLERLLDKRGLAAGKILTESKDDSSLYIDVNLYLNYATVDTNPL